jgi:hypothetical protein
MTKAVTSNGNVWTRDTCENMTLKSVYSNYTRIITCVYRILYCEPRVDLYDEGSLKEENVRKWCRLFKEGGTKVHDEERSGRANISSGKFLSILHTVPTLHQVIVPWFSTSSNFWPVRLWGVTDQKTKDVVLDWLKALAATFLDKCT